MSDSVMLFTASSVDGLCDTQALPPLSSSHAIPIMLSLLRIASSTPEISQNGWSWTQNMQIVLFIIWGMRVCSSQEPRDKTSHVKCLLLMSLRSHATFQFLSGVKMQPNKTQQQQTNNKTRASSWCMFCMSEDKNPLSVTVSVIAMVLFPLKEKLSSSLLAPPLPPLLT